MDLRSPRLAQHLFEKDFDTHMRYMLFYLVPRGLRCLAALRAPAAPWRPASERPSLGRPALALLRRT